MSFTVAEKANLVVALASRPLADAVEREINRAGALASVTLPTVPATFADLAAARTAVEAQRAAVETAINAIIAALK